MKSASVDPIRGRFTVRRILRGVRYRIVTAPKRIAAVGFSSYLTLQNRFSSSPAVGGAPVMVSMTTYGARFMSVHLALESIAQGAVRPARLVLWVDDETLRQNPTPHLRRLVRRGLEIRPCVDYGPHKKYFPALSLMESAKDLDRLITTDDDILYRRRWLSQLLSTDAADAETVLCHRARVAQVDSSGMRPWAEWPLCRSTRESLLNLAIGDAGVSYPRVVLDALTTRGTDFVRFAPRADDIWLHSTSLMVGSPTRQVRARPYLPLMIPGSQKVALAKENISGGANDRQITETYSAEQVSELRRVSESSMHG